jgi:hypothetical protein
MDEALLADKGKPANHITSLFRRILPINGVERKIVPIRGEIFSQPPREGEVLLVPSELQRALRNRDRVAEPAVLGVSSGDCPDEDRAFPTGQPICLLCQLQGSWTIPQRRIRSGR